MGEGVRWPQCWLEVGADFEAARPIPLVACRDFSAITWSRQRLLRNAARPHLAVTSPSWPLASHVCSFCQDGGPGPRSQCPLCCHFLPLCSLSGIPASLPGRTAVGNRREKLALPPACFLPWPSLVPPAGLAWPLPGGVDGAEQRARAGNSAPGSPQAGAVETRMLPAGEGASGKAERWLYLEFIHSFTHSLFIIYSFVQHVHTASI